MSTTRRDFLRGSAGMGMAAFAAGCVSRGGWFGGTQGAPMHGFAAPKIPHIPKFLRLLRFLPHSLQK